MAGICGISRYGCRCHRLFRRGPLVRRGFDTRSRRGGRAVRDPLGLPSQLRIRELARRRPSKRLLRFSSVTSTQISGRSAVATRGRAAGICPNSQRLAKRDETDELASLMASGVAMTTDEVVKYARSIKV